MLALTLKESNQTQNGILLPYMSWCRSIVTDSKSFFLWDEFFFNLQHSSQRGNFSTLLSFLSVILWKFLKRTKFLDPISSGRYRQSLRVSSERSNFYLNSFFPRIFTMWNRLLGECLQILYWLLYNTYDLGLFKLRFSRYIMKRPHIWFFLFSSPLPLSNLI